MLMLLQTTSYADTISDTLLELNRQLEQVINHYSEAVQQLNCVNAIGQFQS